MSKEKRYLQWGYDSFKDTKTGEISDNYIHILNQQDQRITELEEQLKNAIVPKFKVGQEVWWTYKDDIIENYVISDIRFMYFGDDGLWLGDEDIFATKEEALAKLKERTDKSVKIISLQ